MIFEVEGDILLSKVEAIAHGIALDDDFKQGLALQLRERWPSMYKDFRHYCQTKSPRQGTLWTWRGPESGAIINLLTQQPPAAKGSHPGKATLQNVGHCLGALAEEIRREGYKSLALPRLATGVGGLDWKDVKPLVEQHLSSLNIPIYVYVKYVKGQAGER
jgi:O-acetyl-ADP-ribose deacetylase (regulator of RNase III)